MFYEFYIYTKSGDDVWYWDLKDTDKVNSNIKDYINDKTFSVEVNCYHGKYGDEGLEQIEIYLNDNSEYLPKYVQKYTDKVIKVYK